MLRTKRVGARPRTTLAIKDAKLFVDVSGLLDLVELHGDLPRLSAYW